MSKKVYLIITGGGSAAIGKILERGGMSDYFIGGWVPYSTAQVDKAIGGRPDKYCSREVAEKLAVVAYTNARIDSPTADVIMGVGVSASLHKAGDERPDRENVAHVVFQVNNVTYYEYIDFKHVRKLDSDSQRADQERYLSDLINTRVHCWTKGWENSETFIESTMTAIDEELMKIYDPVCNIVALNKMKEGTKYCIYPGSFNPVHTGHIQLAKLSYEQTKCPVVFELSIINFEKPVIHPTSLQVRIDDIMQYENEPWFGGIVVTKQKHIGDKIATIVPAYVILGQDTALRLLRTLEFNGGRDLIGICSRQCTGLLVYNRKGWEKAYLEERKRMNDVMIDSSGEFEDLFIDVPEDVYTDDGTASRLIRMMDNAVC